MSYLESILIYIPAVAIGFLLVHPLWPECGLFALLFKLSLGAGAGLGLTSLFYFIILLVMPVRFPFLTLQIIILLVLLFITIRREHPTLHAPRITFRTSRNTNYALLIFLLFILITLASFINFSIRRDQGAFDAWMIYNRAARFIFRDPANWQATLSPDLYWGFHADYPLLVSTNVAWAWASLGTENIRVPLMQSGLFLFACIGLLFTALVQVKGIRQASLAAIILMSISGFVRSGSGQIADVPLIFFILAGIVLLYLAIQNNSNSLFALSGLMTGLAGWVKNEGLLVIVVSLVVLFFFCIKQQKSLKSFLRFCAGLLFPTLVITYFKVALAPPSDLFVGSLSENFAKFIDPTRYGLILKASLNQILYFGNWPFSLVISLLIYGLVLGFHLPEDSRKAFWLALAIIVMQLLGYIGVYLITPHDLAWHLGTSFGRTVMQVFPSLLFLFFISLKDFGIKSRSKEATHHFGDSSF
jgi:hypothetical protein